MSEHDPSQERPPAPEPAEGDEREAQAEDPTSPVRGFDDLDEAEAQADEAEEG